MKWCILMLYMLLTAVVAGQQMAITTEGDSVILYADGTWKALTSFREASPDIITDPEKYKRSKKAEHLIKSQRVPVGFWVNDQKWDIDFAPNHDAAEFELTYKEGNLYALIINEDLNLPLLSLAKIAEDNGRLAAPDLQVVKKEYRTVNDLPVLMMQMTGTIYDIKFTYYGYYYTDENISTQFLVYSTNEIIAEKESEIEELLNGLILLEE